MPKLINALPSALLQALGIHDDGLGPRQLHDNVQGTYPLEEHYFAAQQKIGIASMTGVTLADSGPFLVVPNGEYWRIQAVSGVMAPSGTGAIMGYTIFLQQPPVTTGNQYVPLFTSGPPRASLAGEARYDLGGMVPSPWIAMPGTTFQAATTVPPGGALSVIIQVRVLYQLLRTE